MNQDPTAVGTLYKLARESGLPAGEAAITACANAPSYKDAHSDSPIIKYGRPQDIIIEKAPEGPVIRRVSPPEADESLDVRGVIGS